MISNNHPLEELFTLSDELKNLSGRIEKENLIKEQKDNDPFKLYLKYTLDSLYTYGLQSKKLTKAMKLIEDKKVYTSIEHRTLFDIFEYLLSNNTGTDENAMVVAGFIQSQPARYHQWLIESITKTFKMGITAKTVNKALGEDLIFNFDVMLAHPFDKYADKVKGQTMYVTEKLDGIRSLWVKENGKIKGFSRQGKPLIGYDHIEQELLSLHVDNVVFDGELLVANSEDYKDREVMQQTNSIASSKGDKSQLQLHLYDIVDLEGFKQGKSKHKYSERRELLNLLNMGDLENVKVLPILYVGNDLDKVMSILSEVEKEGKEGLMVNLDGYYTLTRSNQILKLKTFNSFDERIIEIVSGDGRLKDTLGAIKVLYKGQYPLMVGSGFTDEQRKLYWDNPDLIIGKIAEIQYFRESSNKQGGLSVSFPVFVTIKDKDEPSYN